MQVWNVLILSWCLCYPVRDVTRIWFYSIFCLITSIEIPVNFWSVILSRLYSGLVTNILQEEVNTRKYLLKEAFFWMMTEKKNPLNKVRLYRLSRFGNFLTYLSDTMDTVGEKLILHNCLKLELYKIFSCPVYLSVSCWKLGVYSILKEDVLGCTKYSFFFIQCISSYLLYYIPKINEL